MNKERANWMPNRCPLQQLGSIESFSFIPSPFPHHSTMSWPQCAPAPSAELTDTDNTAKFVK